MITDNFDDLFLRKCKKILQKWVEKIPVQEGQHLLSAQQDRPKKSKQTQRKERNVVLDRSCEFMMFNL